VPSSAWDPAPPSAPASAPIEPHPYAEAAHPYAQEAEPHPYRTAAPAGPAVPPGNGAPPSSAFPPFPAGGFNGFGTGSRGSAAAEFGSQAPAREPGTVSGSRPPGISAFGDQRVRVPGATLSDLPDAPPEVATPSRGGPSTAPPAGPARQTSNGLPVRGSGAATVRPGEPGYPSLTSPSQGSIPTAFTPSRGGSVQGGSGFAPRSGEDSGALPPRRQDTSPYAASAAQAVAAPRTGGFGTPAGDPAAVPQPRTPIEPEAEAPAAEAPHGAAATGIARPVSASASVPVASRVAPPAGADEAPPPAAAPRAPRVYGRATPAEPTSPATPEQRTSSPQSPAAPPVSARATASARVTPPPANGHPFAPGSPAGYGAGTPGGFASGSPAAFAPGSPAPSSPTTPDAPPFSEHTSDLAGRGRAQQPPARAPFSEHTTDLAGRGRATDQPYVPAPALPTLHPSAPPADSRNSGFPGQPGRAAPANGFGSGPANRATVTPPGPADTASWPGPAADGDQGRFDAFKPEVEIAPADKPEAVPNVRKLPVLIAVLLVSALLVGGSLGIVWLVARPSSTGFEVSPGQCVKRDGAKAVTATCGDAESFEVVSKVDTKEQCSDPGQPYVLNPAGNGRNQVLCLKPRG
jgi:collagen type III alpha